MNIKELNKLIKEELDAFLENEDELDANPEGGDDIEVTTDEPAEEEDPLALLRQIYDMLKPVVDDEGGDEFEVDAEDEGEPVEDEEGEGVEDEVEDEEEEVEENFSLKENVNKALYDLFDAHDDSYSREDFPKGKNSKTFPNTQGLKPGSYSIDIEDENISGKKVHFRVDRDNIIMSFNMLSESDKVEENFNTLNESRQLKARFRKLANIKK